MSFFNSGQVYQNGQPRGVKIYINVYNLSPLNYYLHSIGVGIYHTGVQVGNVEYSFGYHDGTHTGVCQSEPKSANMEGVQFREQIFMGECTLPESDVRRVIQDLSRAYAGNSYDLFARNCNCFSNDLCMRLLNRPIPKHLNRIAKVAHYLRCCFPKRMLNGDGQQVDATTSSASSSSASTSQQSSSQSSFSKFSLNGQPSSTAKPQQGAQHGYKGAKVKSAVGNVHTLHFSDDVESDL